MPVSTDLIGRRFDHLLVIEKAEEKEQRYRTWLCLCDCGNQIVVNTKNLTQGRRRDCGCRKQRRIRKTKDHTKEKYGALTVEAFAGVEGGSSMWKCRCDCGGIINVPTTRLVRLKQKDCGCGRGRERVNYKDISGWQKGLLLALYPTEKRDRKGSIVWMCRCDCGNIIEMTESDFVYGNSVSCGCVKKENWKTFNKRYLNFADGTCVEWLKSRKSRSDNTSGCTGVQITKKCTYKVSITMQGKNYYLGTYTEYEEAVQIRKLVEKHLHGGFVDAWYRWQKIAENNEEWASANPFFYDVNKIGRSFVIRSPFENNFRFNY